VTRNVIIFGTIFMAAISSLFFVPPWQLFALNFQFKLRKILHRVRTCFPNWLPLAKHDIFQKYKLRDFLDIYGHKWCVSRFRYPHGLRCRFAAVRLVGLPVRIPPRRNGCLLWLSCVIRYRSLRRSDHSSRGVLPRLVDLSDREASIMMRSWPIRGCCAIKKFCKL
jgi:hypothetical protein